MPEQETMMQKRRRGKDRQRRLVNSCVKKYITFRRQAGWLTKTSDCVGLSKARRTGVKLPPPKKGRKSAKVRAATDYRKGQKAAHKKANQQRVRATLMALK